MTQELRKLAEEAKRWEAAGCPVTDPHDTYPQELFHAAANPTAILAILDERDQLQAMNERLAHANNALKLSVSGMQSQLDTATQSSAHWQHQCTELQSRLDAMGKGEAVGEWKHCSPELLASGVSCRDTPRRPCGCDHGGSHDHWIAAPKALAPLTDEQIYETIIQWDEGGGKRSRRELARRLTRLTNQQQQVANLILHDGLRIASPIESNSGLGADIEHRFEVSDGNKRLGVIVIFTELADHGIHAKGGQHEDA